MNSDRLTGSAAQKRVLFRLFPLIFNDIAPLLPSIRVYKILQEILELVLAYPFRRSWLPRLRDLCAEFQHAMLHCFPTRMSPKIHFTAEYAHVIEDYGPATRYWCMRYESRHAYFKQVALKSNNYKNVAQTLATRYQLKQSLFMSKPILYSNENMARGLKGVKESHLNQKVKALINHHFGDINIEEDLFECSTLCHDHVEYHQSCVHVIALEGAEERPLFAQIVRIVRVQTSWMLLVDHVRTKCYHDDLCAWEIETLDDFALVDPRRLKYFHKGLDVYEINRSSYVCIGSRLTNWD